MVYPALLPLINTSRLPVVDWTEAPADLNGLTRFAERRNLVSACVPSHFNWPLTTLDVVCISKNADRISYYKYTYVWMLFITCPAGNSKHKKKSCIHMQLCWILCKEYRKVKQFGDTERGERSKYYVTKLQTEFSVQFVCRCSVSRRCNVDMNYVWKWWHCASWGGAYLTACTVLAFRAIGSSLDLKINTVRTSETSAI
jgi:hypothetical protein